MPTDIRAICFLSFEHPDAIQSRRNTRGPGRHRCVRFALSAIVRALRKPIEPPELYPLFSLSPLLPSIVRSFDRPRIRPLSGRPGSPPPPPRPTTDFNRLPRRFSFSPVRNPSLRIDSRMLPSDSLFFRGFNRIREDQGFPVKRIFFSRYTAEIHYPPLSGFGPLCSRLVTR